MKSFTYSETFAGSMPYLKDLQAFLERAKELGASEDSRVSLSFSRPDRPGYGDTSTKASITWNIKDELTDDS